MKTITVQDKVFRLMIRNKAILKSIDKVAARINRDYRSCTQPPILLCILNGAMPYATELMQRLDFDHELACMKAKSYDGTLSTGKVSITIPPTANLKGRRVIICEDIVDTGITVRQLKSYLNELEVEDVRTTTLLVKPSNLCAQLKKEGLVGEIASRKDIEAFLPEYPAMEIPDDFIVGFGLDYNELGRNYKDIYVLDEQ